MTRRAILLLISLGVLAGAAALLARFLNTAASPEQTELLWEDPPLHLAVTFRDRLSGQATWLTVTDGAQTTRKLLDDDCPLGNVTLVQYEGWLLVLNGPYVLGGYHRPSRRLVGEHEWDQLPFTVRSASGTVLVRGRTRRAWNNDTPAQFPLKPDPRTTPGTSRSQSKEIYSPAQKGITAASFPTLITPYGLDPDKPKKQPSRPSEDPHP